MGRGVGVLFGLCIVFAVPGLAAAADGDKPKKNYGTDIAVGLSSTQEGQFPFTARGDLVFKVSYGKNLGAAVGIRTKDGQVAIDEAKVSVGDKSLLLEAGYLDVGLGAEQSRARADWLWGDAGKATEWMDSLGYGNRGAGFRLSAEPSGTSGIGWSAVAAFPDGWIPRLSLRLAYSWDDGTGILCAAGEAWPRAIAVAPTGAGLATMLLPVVDGWGQILFSYRGRRLTFALHAGAGSVPSFPSGPTYAQVIWLTGGAEFGYDLESGGASVTPTIRLGGVLRNVDRPEEAYISPEVGVKVVPLPNVSLFAGGGISIGFSRTPAVQPTWTVTSLFDL